MELKSCTLPPFSGLIPMGRITGGLGFFSLLDMLVTIRDYFPVNRFTNSIEKHLKVFCFHYFLFTVNYFCAVTVTEHLECFVNQEEFRILFFEISLSLNSTRFAISQQIFCEFFFCCCFSTEVESWRKKNCSYA